MAAPKPAGHTRRVAVLRQVPALVILAGLIGSFAIMIPEQFSYRAACTALAATCALAAAMRLFLPTHWVGVLAVRSRLLDGIILLAMSVAVAILAFSVPLPRP